MSFISILYTNNLRTEAVHLRSKTKILTDAPVDNQGQGLAFSPTDLVATALASCMITVMGIQAKHWGIALDGSSIEVEKIMAADPRRIHQVIMVIRVPDVGLDKKQQEILIHKAVNCPVANSLHPDLIQQVAFEFENE